MQRISARLNAIIDVVSKQPSASGQSAKYEELKKKIDKAVNSNIKVLICGEFKQGKSSFVNTLLGERLCPVDEEICTSAVSIIKYGPVRKVTRAYGELQALQEEVISFDRLHAYSVGDAAQIDNTVLLKIEVPNEKLKNGLILIDTPGVGGMDIRHGFLTTYFMPQADISLFVTDTDEPMTASELAFYRQKVHKYARFSSIILSKIDRVDSGECRILVSDVKSKVGRECCVDASDVDVIAVSAVTGQNMSAVEEKITQLMNRGRTDLLCDVRNQLVAELTAQVAALKIQLQQIRKPDEEITRKLAAQKAELDSRVRSLRDPNSEFRLAVKRKITEIRETVINHLNEQSIIFSSQALEMLRQRMHNENKTVKWVGEQIQTALETIGAEMTIELRRAFNEIASFEEFNGLLRYDVRDFNVSIDLERIQENDVAFHRRVLPVLSSFGVGSMIKWAAGSLLGGPIGLCFGIMAGLATFISAHDEVQNSTYTRTISQAYQPQIQVAMNNLREYVNTRFLEFETELLSVVGQCAEKAQTDLNKLMTQLNTVLNDYKQAEARGASIERELKPMEAQLSLAKLILSDPLGSSRPLREVPDPDETQC